MTLIPIKSHPKVLEVRTSIYEIWEKQFNSYWVKGGRGLM
jgi:hypothetical protein